MPGFFRTTVEDVYVASWEIAETLSQVTHDEHLSFISHLHQILIICANRNAETLRTIREGWTYSDTIHQALLLVEDRDRLQEDLARISEPVGALLLLLSHRLI
jgi:hypothetical protein